ncbi:uncharacterized protein LOC135848225 [Planococcus citri]|uniref:uncharacterized protein LOC135848225 n=1 Tax=Planococcus citri TaxID=170843 RepID=UPI0031F730D1
MLKMLVKFYWLVYFLAGAYRVFGYNCTVSDKAGEPKKLNYCDLFLKNNQNPSKTWSLTTDVHITITSWYVDLDIINGIFELRGMINMKWLGQQITWKSKEPDDYYLNITDNSIWRPKIHLENQAFEHDMFIGLGNTTVSNNGVMTHVAPLNIRSRCQINSYSPHMDSNTCQLNFTIDIIHANVTFQQKNYSDIISPWAIARTQFSSSLEIDQKDEAIIKSVAVNVTLQKNSQLTPCSELASNSLEKLICELSLKYNPSITPDTTSRDFLHALNFTIFYADVDVSGMFQLIGVVEATWEDPQLTWKPSEYNFTEINIQNISHQIWKPDFVLVNSEFHDTRPLLDSGYMTMVSNQGLVRFYALSISLQAKCPVAINNMPWNQQTCQLHFNTSAPNPIFNITHASESPLAKFINSTSEKNIPSPWIVHEMREMKQTNDGHKSSNYSVSIEVELHRNDTEFHLRRCVPFARSYEEELKCRLFSKDLRRPIGDTYRRGPHTNIEIDYVDLNIENEVFFIRGQLILKWPDERLSWDPSEFGNRFNLSIKEHGLWTPRIALDNELLGENHLELSKDFYSNCYWMEIDCPRSPKFLSGGRLEVSSDGNLTWTLPMNFDTKCDMKSNGWPWDPQTCYLDFTINTHEMRIRLKYSEFTERLSLWKIVQTYSKEPSTAFKLEFKFDLEMKSYSLQVKLSLIFIGVSLVMLTSFLIPPMNKFKVILKILSVKLVAIFLAILMYSIPQFTTRAPNFLIGYIILLAVVGISSCVTAYLVRLARKSRLNNPSANKESTNPEESKSKNDTILKTISTEAIKPTNDEYASGSSKTTESETDWLKIAIKIEFSSFAICLIISVILIISLMN